MHIIKKILAFILTPLVKGSSVVVKENLENLEVAIKYSKPRLFVRFIYLLFYLRWQSPYESLTGISRAVKLRGVQNHVSKFRLGIAAFVKPVLANRGLKNGRWYPYLAMEWIDGNQVGRKEGEKFAKSLVKIFIEAGLPTWSITQPDAHKDMRWVNGRIICLDAESVLPNLFISREERLMIREGGGGFAPIDFVNFHRLKKELEEAKNEGYSDYFKFRLSVAQLELLSHIGGFL